MRQPFAISVGICFREVVLEKPEDAGKAQSGHIFFLARAGGGGRIGSILAIARETAPHWRIAVEDQVLVPARQFFERLAQIKSVRNGGEIQGALEINGA